MRIDQAIAEYLRNFHNFHIPQSVWRSVDEFTYLGVSSINWDWAMRRKSNIIFSYGVQQPEKKIGNTTLYGVVEATIQEIFRQGISKKRMQNRITLIEPGEIRIQQTFEDSSGLSKAIGEIITDLHKREKRQIGMDDETITVNNVPQSLMVDYAIHLFKYTIDGEKE